MVLKVFFPTALMGLLGAGVMIWACSDPMMDTVDAPGFSPPTLWGGDAAPLSNETRDDTQGGTVHTFLEMQRDRPARPRPQPVLQADAR